MAAGVEETSVGSNIASSANVCSVASIPRVAPRSLSAATASKNAWSTVVFSDVMNLQRRSISRAREDVDTPSL